MGFVTFLPSWRFWSPPPWETWGHPAQPLMWCYLTSWGLIRVTGLCCRVASSLLSSWQCMGPCTKPLCKLPIKSHFLLPHPALMNPTEPFIKPKWGRLHPPVPPRRAQAGTRRSPCTSFQLQPGWADPLLHCLHAAWVSQPQSKDSDRARCPQHCLSSITAPGSVEQSRMFT